MEKETMKKETRTTIMAHIPVYQLEDLSSDIKVLYTQISESSDDLNDISSEIIEDLANISANLRSIINNYREYIDYEQAKKIIKAYYSNDNSYFYTPEDLANAQNCICVGIAKGELEINAKNHN